MMDRAGGHGAHGARQAPRAPLRGFVELRHCDFDEPFEAEALNVSQGGLAMRSPYLPDVGCRFQCRFPTVDHHDCLEAEAEVVWVEDSGPYLGEFGVRFLTGRQALRLGMHDADATIVDVQSPFDLDPGDTLPDPETLIRRGDGKAPDLAGLLASAQVLGCWFLKAGAQLLRRARTAAGARANLSALWASWFERLHEDFSRRGWLERSRARLERVRLAVAESLTLTRRRVRSLFRRGRRTALSQAPRRRPRRKQSARRPARNRRALYVGLLAVGSGGLLAYAAVPSASEAARPESRLRAATDEAAVAPEPPQLNQPLGGAERRTSSTENAAEVAGYAERAQPPTDPRASAPAPAAPTPAEEPMARSAGTSFGDENLMGGKVFVLRMSQPVRTLWGTPAEDGFRVVIPGSLSLDPAGPIASRHPGVERSMILNRGDRSVLSVTFAPYYKPAYRVSAQGAFLEIRISD